MTHHLKNALTIFLALTGLWLTASAQGSSRYGYSNSRLSGTWRLNAGRSDDPSAAADAPRALPVNDRQRAGELVAPAGGAGDAGD